MNLEHTSVRIDSSATSVPFSLQLPDKRYALTGTTRLSPAEEQEKKGGFFCLEILKNLWFNAL
jgi:hypothetical protein